ncbi:hypothetical protein FRC07_010939, partial [Ceratobasidium sp. 392]
MVIRAYMYISQNYRPGDNVCLFGYSRGAFVARKVAGLLHRIGIVGNREELFDQWKRREKPVPWDKVIDTPQSVPVRCIGVWDTVGAIYSSPDCEVKDLLGIPDAELSPNIELALHVCAFHENRRRFRVTLFEPNPDSKTTLKEVWFPGAHSDVGGGGEKPTQMPRLSLIWMIGELKAFLDISDEKIKYPSLSKLEPLDAYNDSPSWKRLVDKCETRLESQALGPTSKLHQTVKDIQQAVNAHHTPHHMLLTVRDLLSMRWDLQSCLIRWNPLEDMKRQSIRADPTLRYGAVRALVLNPLQQSGQSNARNDSRNKPVVTDAISPVFAKEQKKAQDTGHHRRRVPSNPAPPTLS